MKNNIYRALKSLSQKVPFFSNKIFIKAGFWFTFNIFRTFIYTNKTLKETKEFTYSYYKKEIELFRQFNNLNSSNNKDCSLFYEKFKKEVFKILPKELREDAPRSKNVKIGKTVFMICLQGYSSSPINTKRKIDIAKNLAEKSRYDFILITKKNILDYVVIPNQFKEIVNNFLSSDVKSTPSNHWSRAKDKDYLLALTFLGSYAWSGTYLNMKYGGICVNDTILFNKNFRIDEKNSVEHMLSKKYFSANTGNLKNQNLISHPALKTQMKGKWSLETNASNINYHPIFVFVTMCINKLYCDDNITNEMKIFYNQNFIVDYIKWFAYENIDYIKKEIDNNSSFNNTYLYSLNYRSFNKLISKNDFLNKFKNFYCGRLDDRYDTNGSNNEIKKGDKASPVWWLYNN